MQAVILAAGKSTRAYPLTLTRPKPLLKAANKAILEHNLDNLNGIADEIILIVGYKKEMIKGQFGNKYKNLKLKYVEQKEQLGTGHAASLAEPYIRDKFILMAGDDIYSRKDIRKCIKYNYSILTSTVKDPSNASELRSKRTRSQLTNFGVIIQKKGILTDFVEKPKSFVSYTINTSLYTLDKKIFHCLKKIRKSERNELELPDAIMLLSKSEKVHCVKARQWLPIGYPWDLLKADRILGKNKNIIGKNSKIKGRIINSTIGDNCLIEGIVKNSVIMDNSVIGKNSVVEGSVIGENVHFSGTIKSKSNDYSAVNGKKVKIGRFGAVIGDNVIAKNTAIEAGCRIWPGKKISNKIIKKDLI